MRILDRYLIRGFSWALAYCIGLFFLLFIVIDAFNNLDEFLKHGVGLRVVTSYYLFSLPAIFVQIVPLGALVAVLYTLGNLNRHNEIIALKASGISSFHILAPYLFSGVLISFFIFFVNEFIVPPSVITSTAIREGLIEKGKKNFQERSIKNVTLFGKKNRMIFAREFEVLSDTMYDVVIFEDNPRQGLQTKLTAQKAQYINGQWIFYDTMCYQVNRRGDLVGDPTFLAEVKLGVDEKPEDFLNEASQVEFMNTKQLKEYMDHLKGVSQKLMRRLSVDFHYKIAFPFVSLVVILIGAPLAMKTKRGGAIMGIGTSFGVVVAYYAIHSICLALGKGGLLPPLFSAWFGNLLFAAVGIYLIKKTS